jgi:hypothetical protein
MVVMIGVLWLFVWWGHKSRAGRIMAHVMSVAALAYFLIQAYTGRSGWYFPLFLLTLLLVNWIPWGRIWRRAKGVGSGAILG